MKEQCIELDMLARYVGNTLSTEQKSQVEAHLAACDACLQDFVIANKLIKDEEPDEWEPISQGEAHALWKKFRANVCTVWEWTRAATSELVQQSQLAWVGLASVRNVQQTSAITHVHLTRTMGAFQTVFFIEKKEDDKISMKIRVSEEGRIPGHLRLALTRKGQREISRSMKQDYAFFDNLHFGVYRLTLTQFKPNQTWDLFFEISEAGFDENADVF